MSKIAYDLRLVRGFAFDIDGVLSPTCIPLGADGLPQRMVNIKDGYALQLAIKLGYHVAIISGAYSPAIEARYAGLGIADIYMKAGVKIDVLRQWMELRGLTPEQVAYAGDDIPDYECMLAAGLAVAPRDAAPDIKAAARYITPCDGGQGVARDIIEQTMRAQGCWMASAKAFGW